MFRSGSRVFIELCVSFASCVVHIQHFPHLQHSQLNALALCLPLFGGDNQTMGTSLLAGRNVLVETDELTGKLLLHH